ncbi:precorrin-4 C(11)-methyltransferase [Bartonella tamiae]|uniref:Precorrin-4 C11-methyltransferase n=1 Tax=Bartonella tamiae Th239 TaxID=1094558 RepID=J1JWI5_9HYPH|nr:precorrin-4 C(11)-methyltransferase [Bartonella tamiae]EJF88925.1 precorrin-4 C11-methyltransferase [Bartonella tamiae Th239]EJF94825.1 precorrin-4 C11-methyltransferase [Bartonella tamiae Th307]
MTVYFIGAGPGAADLITLRGFNLIKRCPICLYAGSLVSDMLIAEVSPTAKCINTAHLHLQQIIDEIKKAHDQGHDIARLHSGDPSLYGAINEQIQALKILEIPFEIVPGVPSFTAAAAAMKLELTLPGINQSVILTRTSVRSSAMPDLETLKNLAQSKATMVIHLSIQNLTKIQDDLIPIFGEECPVVVAYRISWPDEIILRANLSNISEKIAETSIKKTALIFIGRGLHDSHLTHSYLYSEEAAYLRTKARTSSTDE